MNSTNFTLSHLNPKTNKRFHFKETTILFLLKGDLVLNFNNEEIIARDGDILVFNPNDSVKITKVYRQSCSLFELNIDTLFFASLYPRFFSTKFECFPKHSETGKREVIFNLRKHLSELLLAHFSIETTKNLRVSMALNQVLLLLVQFFQKEDNYYKYSTYNEKIMAVIAFLGENYQQPITLEEVADHFFMSSSAMSKFFKQETGHYFSHYLNNLRVQQSLHKLLYTRQSIEEVATDCGFGNSKTYRLHFKKNFDLSPSDYRTSRMEERERAEEPKSIKKEVVTENNDVLASLYYYAHLPKDESSPFEVVEKHKKLAITTQEVRDQVNADVIIQIGSFEDLLKEEVRSEIKLAMAEVGVAYVGLQKLFDEIPASYQAYKSEQMSIFSPFGKFDTALNFLFTNNIGVYYQLSLTDFERISHFYKLDRQAFLEHIENKFGTPFLANWKINCLFNPHHLKQEIEIFNEIVATCRRINPVIQIGAELPIHYPNYAFPSSKLEQDYWLTVVPTCQFLSFKSEPNYIYETTEDKLPNLENFHEYVYKEALYFKQLLQTKQINLPLYLSEWNTLTGANRNTNGAFFRGAIVLQEVLKLDLLVAGYGFWLNTELYEEYQEFKPIKYDGLELFHNYFAKRPAYRVLEIAGRLKGKVRAIGEEFLLVEENGHYKLLLWNTNYFAPHLSLEESFMESQSTTIRLEIPEIQDNLYQVKQLDFDRHHGAIFYAYQEFQSSAPLDFESHVYLAESSHPKMKVFDVEVKNGFDFYCFLDTNAILLLELTPIKFKS